MVRPVVHFSTIDSTNRKAVELAAAGAISGTLITAEQQTRGRGREGRIFSSPPGGLYCSLILHVGFPHERLPLASLAAGIGSCLALEDVARVNIQLKWPNDLMIGARKLGGILTESTGPSLGRETSSLVIGVGINVNSLVTDFQEDLQPILTTLRTVTGTSYNLADLCLILAENIEQWISRLGSNPDRVLAAWRDRDYLQGKAMRFLAGKKKVQGIGAGLDQEGQYCLRTSKGALQKIVAGDIVVLSDSGSSSAIR